MIFFRASHASLTEPTRFTIHCYCALFVLVCCIVIACLCILIDIVSKMMKSNAIIVSMWTPLHPLQLGRKRTQHGYNAYMCFVCACLLHYYCMLMYFDWYSIKNYENKRYYCCFVNFFAPVATGPQANATRLQCIHVFCLCLPAALLLLYVYVFLLLSSHSIKDFDNKHRYCSLS